MLNAQSMPPRLFNLEGVFQGFIGGTPKKPKSILLDVEQEQLAIQLPKELRAYAGTSIKVGDRLQCFGSSQIDFKAGVIKLQAYQVFIVASAAAQQYSTFTSARPVAAPPPSPKVCNSHAHPSRILVCRKSGCQKRGGRKMVETLEQILQTHNLQDQVEICYTGCQKRCSQSPNLTLMPGKHRYDRVNAKDLTALIEEHFCQFTAPGEP